MVNKLVMLKKYYPWFMWIVLIVLFLLRYAEPIKDGDVFFHIKYGEYHVENQTMLMDHSLYSWTQAAKYVPYCTWAADVIFYLLYSIGGWPLLYVFKYLCLFSPILMVCLLTKKLRFKTNSLSFFVMLVVLFAVINAAYLKPELLSLVFFVLVASLYFFIKSDHDNEKKAFYFLLYPILFLLWVNMHGVFIFGLILFASIIAGEFINFLIQSKFSFSKKTMAIITTSGAASVAATLLTPYGLDYHTHLFNAITQGLSESIVESISAYQSIVANIGLDARSHNFEHWIIMAVLFTVLFALNAIRNRDWDFGILLPTVFLAMIALKYERSTFYWPTFWAMSILYLSSKQRLNLPYEFSKIKPIVKYSLIVLLSSFFIYIPARAVYEVYYRPLRWQYFGFGFSYVLPVQESDFLKNNRIGSNLFNSYNTGSYLIFAHYPDRKVFIDPRSFPYMETVYGRYKDFQQGRLSLEEIEAEFDIDIALIEHSERILRKFLVSDNWRPVFYGIGGVVFVRNDIPFENDIKSLDKHRFDGLKNVVQAADIVVTAQNLGDYQTAAHVISIMKDNLSHLNSFEYFYDYCTSTQNGLEAYENGDYQGALKNLWRITGRSYASNPKVFKILKELIYFKLQEYITKGDYNKGLGLMVYTLKYFPNDPNIIYNTGIAHYLTLQHDKKEIPGVSENLWRELFEKLLTIAPDHPQAPIAKQLLMDTNSNERSPLIFRSDGEIDSSKEPNH